MTQGIGGSVRSHPQCATAGDKTIGADGMPFGPLPHVRPRRSVTRRVASTGSPSRLRLAP